MAELKPCPFCGGRAKIYVYSTTNEHNAVSKRFKIKCGECGVEFTKGFRICVTLDDNGNFTFDTNEKDLAIEAWNRRVEDETEGRY